MIASLRRNLRLACALLGALPVFLAAQATDLFISEYVEGSSNNKGIEIFNGTGATVDLGAYEVWLYANTDGTVSNRVTLGTLQATLGDGEVLVLKNSSFTTYTGPGYNATVANFNGDDPVVLLFNGNPIDVLGVFEPRANFAKDVTLRRGPEVSGPNTTYDPNEWTQLERDDFSGLGAHTFTGGADPKPEPSEYPSDFLATVSPAGVVTLSWTDSAGADLPSRYAILVSSAGAPALPVDGAPVSADADFSDGAGLLLANYGVETLTVAGLPSETTFTFTLIPFSNGGSAVDFKTDGTPPATAVTTPQVVLWEPFEAIDAWAIVTLAGDPEWNVSTGAAQANAYGASAPADDWLISPPLELSAGETFVLNLATRRQFDDAGFNPALSVLASGDYDGSGTIAAVEAATWIDLGGGLPTEESATFASSGDVLLSGFEGSVYLAFRYQSSGTTSGTTEWWLIDEVLVYPSTASFPALDLSLAPTAVPDDAGADAVTATVSIDTALPTPLVVSIQNGDASRLTTPASVTIEAGATTATFAVGVVGTPPLTESATISLGVSASGYVGDSAPLVVQPAALRALSLSLAPMVVTEDAGSAASTATVTLSREPEAFPLVVSLSSSDPGEATVPASITFASAADGLTKTFAVAAVADGSFDADAVVTIQAEAADYDAATATLTVTNVDPLPRLILSLDPDSAFENAGSVASVLTVTLEEAPLAGYPLTVNLQSGDPTEASLPATITFAASDERVRTVSVAALEDGIEDGDQSVTLSATASGYRDGAAVLQVLDVDGSSVSQVLGLIIDSTDLLEGSSATGTVLLSTAPDSALTVTLVSGDPTEVGVPATVTVLARAQTVSFPIQALVDGELDGDATVTVVASAADWVSAQRTLVVRNVDVAPELFLELLPATLDEGQTGQLRVRASFVPAGGLTVQLSASDDTELAVPASVTVPASTREVTVPVNAVRDGIVDTDVPVTVVATASGYPAASALVTVNNLDLPRVATLTLRAGTLAEGESVLADITLNVPVAVDTVVPLAPMADLVFPASFTLPAGATAGSFEVTAFAGDGFEGDEDKVLRVFVPGYPGAEATLRVLERDARGAFLAPLSGARFSLDEAIRVRATVADPRDTLEAVEFYLDGTLLARLEAPPYEILYQPDAGLRALVAEGRAPVVQTLTARVFDATLGDAELPGRTIQLVYSPPRSDVDFVLGTWAALTGATLAPEERDALVALLASGTSRESLLDLALGAGEFDRAVQIAEIYLLALDRFPTAEELGAALAAGLETGLGTLADALLLTDEASVRFGGVVAELDTTAFFTPVWRTRHGVAPTAQQLVQAYTRIQAYGSRGEFLAGLVRADRFDLGRSDIIYNPPNNHLEEDARSGVFQVVLWPDDPVDRAPLAPLRGAGREAFIAGLLADPRYWSRFDYAWLNAVRDDDGSDWFESEWFGRFYADPADWPWVYHRDHRWIYAGSDDAGGNGMWWWDLKLGWAWTSSGIYPWLWMHRDGRWLYYFAGTREPRLFWDPVAGDWREE